MAEVRSTVITTIPEGRSASRIKGVLNGRGGKKSNDLVCGACGIVLMSKAPDRAIELIVRCYACNQVNDLAQLQPA
jgi:hypothetical protein